MLRWFKVWTGVQLRPMVPIGTHGFGLRPGSVTPLISMCIIIFRVHHLRVSVPFQHLESCSLLQHTRLPEQMHWGETLATKVNNTIQCDIHESRPHQAELLHVPVPSCSILYRTIRHGGVKLWNYIVKIIGCSVSFVAFKNHINGFLMVYQIRLYAIYYKTICNLLLFLETVA